MAVVNGWWWLRQTSAISFRFFPLSVCVLSPPSHLHFPSLFFRLPYFPLFWFCFFFFFFFSCWFSPSYFFSLVFFFSSCSLPFSSRIFLAPLFSHSLSYCCSSSPEQDQRGFPKQKQVDHKQCQEEEQAMTEQLPLLLLFSTTGSMGE